MSSKLWLKLSIAWPLEDVQAGLSIVITLHCTLALLLCARLYHQSALVRWFDKKVVSPVHMLNAGSVEEVIEVLTLLRGHLFSVANFQLLAQCIVVVVLVVSTQLAGLLARASLLGGQSIVNTTTSGLIVNNRHHGFSSNSKTANVLWNITEQSLDRAQFPHNQLLDFLPTSAREWKYSSPQWNASWKINCDMHNLTGVEIGGPSDQTLPLLNSNWTPTMFAGFEDLLPRSYQNRTAYRHNHAAQGFCECDVDTKRGNCSVSIWYFFVGANPELDNRLYTNTAPYHFTLGVFSLQGAQLDYCVDHQIHYTDQYDKALMSRVDCSLERLATSHADQDEHVAYPWTNVTQSIVDGISDYYRWNSISEFIDNGTVYLPDPKQLIRFYQSYMIIKDTFFAAPVNRVLSVQVPTVYISTASVVILSLLLASTLCGGIYSVAFWLAHRKQAQHIPDSRLSWLLHSIHLHHLQDAVPAVKGAKIGKHQSDRYEFEHAFLGFDGSDGLP